MKEKIVFEFVDHLRNKLTVPVMEISAAVLKLEKAACEIQSLTRHLQNDLETIKGRSEERERKDDPLSSERCRDRIKP